MSGVLPAALRARLGGLRTYLSGSLWFIPAVFVVGAMALARGVMAIDESLDQNQDGWFLFGGAAESARTFLSAIAASMITFTGLVFSITMLVLQLTSSQYSPRSLRTFLRDRVSQITLGLFIATFTFALMALQEVRSELDEQDRFVPAISVQVAFALILVSVAAFVYYIHHVADSIRVETLVTRISRETLAAAERLFADDLDGIPGRDVPLIPADEVIPATSAGAVNGLSLRTLSSCAQACGALVEVVPVPGDFVAPGMPLLRVWGRIDDAARSSLLRSVRQGKDRAVDQDIAFGIRQLVDVAERALSPGINDPTTAVQAIDRIHEILRYLSSCPLRPPTEQLDPRHVVVHWPRWEDYLRLAADEPRTYGATSIQVVRRLRALLLDLLELAPPERREAVREHLAALDRTVKSSYASSDGRAAASSPSQQGHGPVLPG